MSTTKSAATITLLAASATTSAAKSNIATQQTQLVVTHDVHPNNKNKECNTFDTSDIATAAIDTDNSSSWVSIKEDNKDTSDVGILIVTCDDEEQHCIKDGSSSLGGRCTSSSITDNTESSYTTPIIKNQQSVDKPSSSSSKLNKLITSSQSQSTSRNLQSYTFNCPSTCPTGFCNCIESSFSGDEFPNSQCGWHINEVCTSNNGTQLTDDCGLGDSPYLNFIKDGVCPYAGCLLDVQSGEKLLEECECDYYSDYCELYDVYCSVAACCDAAPVGEKTQCLPKSKKEEEDKEEEEEEEEEDTEETFAARPPLPGQDTPACDGVITFIDLDASVNEDNGNQDLVVRYEIGNTCGHEVNLLAGDCETEISGVDISPSDPVEVADGDETKLTFLYSIDEDSIEESNIWNAGSEQVEVCLSFTLLNESGDPMSTENRKVGLQKVVESTPVETTEEDSSTGVSTEETATTEETISTEETSNVLEEVGNNGEPADVFPLGQCQGDCDNDEECQPGLVCMQRDGGEVVPGCEGVDNNGADYCYLPTTSEETEEVATEEPMTSSPVSSPPTTASPISNEPTTASPVSDAPSTASPVSNAPTTAVPTTGSPVTDAPVVPLPQRTGQPTKVVIDLEEEEYDPLLGLTEVVSGLGGGGMSMAPSPASDFVASSVTNKPTVDEAISLIPVRDDDETKSPVSYSGSKNESSGKTGKASLFGKSSKTLSYDSKQSSKATKKKGSKTSSKATKKGGKGSKYHKNKWQAHALERTHDVSGSQSNSVKWGVVVVFASAVLAWMNAC